MPSETTALKHLTQRFRALLNIVFYHSAYFVRVRGIIYKYETDVVKHSTLKYVKSQCYEERVVVLYGDAYHFLSATCHPHSTNP